LEEFVRYESDPVRGVGQHPEHSVRQQQNIILAERAADRLKRFAEDMPEEHFGCDDGVWHALTPRAYLTLEGTDTPPQRVLTELGRCLQVSEDLYWRMVDWYAENIFEHPHRVRSEDVAKAIRQYRLTNYR
jgi:hypothetical protein